MIIHTNNRALWLLINVGKYFMFFIAGDMNQQRPLTLYVHASRRNMSENFKNISKIYFTEMCNVIFCVLMNQQESRQHCRLTICGCFGWVWQIVNQKQIQTTIYFFESETNGQAGWVGKISISTGQLIISFPAVRRLPISAGLDFLPHPPMPPYFPL